MRSLDARKIKQSIVGQEGVAPAAPETEQLRFNLERGEDIRTVLLDLGDKRLHKHDSFWAPLYLADLDSGDTQLVASLLFKREAYSEQLIQPGQPLPYLAIAAPSSRNLTWNTWEKHRHQLQTRNRIVGMGVVVAAGIVTGFIYAKKTAKK